MQTIMEIITNKIFNFYAKTLIHIAVCRQGRNQIFLKINLELMYSEQYGVLYCTRSETNGNKCGGNSEGNTFKLDSTGENV